MSRSLTTIEVLRLVAVERQRQAQLLADGIIHYNCSDPKVTPLLKLPILTEEVGEVARELQAIKLNKAKLFTELIQTAAVAVAWAESILEGPL